MNILCFFCNHSFQLLELSLIFDRLPLQFGLYCLVQFFLKFESDIPVGFAQCQLRYDYVEGTKTTPVGYLEGIFIKEEYRNKGYAKQLLAECEAWAKEKGCQEFASDCEINNIDSFHFHKAVNFREANRIICFTKVL